MAGAPQDQRKESVDRKAVGLALIFLVLGLAVAWFVKSIVGLERDAVFVSVLLVPVLVYAIASGRLLEFKAPGGLEARFAEASEKPVTAVAEKVEPSVEEIQIVAKGGVRELRRLEQYLDETQPIIMTLGLGKGHYDREALTQ